MAGPGRPGYRAANRPSGDRPRPQEPQRTVVTLADIRPGAPPPDAALVVVLPRFAPHGALDRAADLGVTADWPILGVIGLRTPGWPAGHSDRPLGRVRVGTTPPRGPTSPGDTRPGHDARNVPNDMQTEREDD